MLTALLPIGIKPMFELADILAVLRSQCSFGLPHQHEEMWAENKIHTSKNRVLNNVPYAWRAGKLRAMHGL
jgi:hypothetical protein